jgi:hypothetical protein
MADKNKEEKKDRKPRNTRAQQIAVLEAKLAEMKAKEAGTFVDTSVLKRLEKRLKQTERELKSDKETQRRATEFEAKLPFDIKRLKAAIEVAKTDQDVNFPEDLTPLQRPEKRTDEQHEANAVVTQDEN